jgi:cyclopropane-fatty-acyl-phospholipid synthase
MINQKILKKFEKIECGFLEIKLPNQKVLSFGKPSSKPRADIKIKDLRLIDLVVMKGDIGLGQGYIENLFETSDLANLLYFFTLNQKQVESFFYGKKLFTIFYAIKHFLRGNNIKGSRKNISHHYDLGNEFYSLWLDSSMTYSSGIFSPNLSLESLEESQRQKYLRIIAELDNGGKDILEIGCGWGGFMEEASKSGFNVLGLTLSQEQLNFAQSRMQRQGLNSKAILKDYRHEEGKYDNIVSIEMFEAVGKKYWNDYFHKVKQCLKPNGKAVVQTITIDENIYESYEKTSDFIREFIFPGGFLPTKSDFEKIAQSNGLKICNRFEFGDSYDKTLAIWLENFEASKSQILGMGFDEAFIRKWRFYLAYCMAGFRSGRIDVVQYSLIHSYTKT